MPNPLQLLWMDQAEDEMQQTIQELRARGLMITVSPITALAALREALRQPDAPQMIIVGEGWELSTIKAVLAEAGTHPPLILLADTVDPDIARQNDVVDYVPRQDWDRLAFILHRALAAPVQTLPTSQQQFRALVENSPDVVALVDINGTLLYRNMDMGRILGYASDELIGSSLFNLLDHEGRLQSDDLLRELLKSPGTQKTIKIHVQGKHGFWRWIEVTGVNLLDSPFVQAIVLNCHDITEQQLAEEALVKRQRELEILLEVSRDLSSVLDLNSLLSFIAQRAVTLLDADECVLFQLDDDGQTLRPILVIGEYVQQRLATRLTVGQGFVGSSVAINQPILSNNAHYDPRGVHVPGTPVQEIEHIMVAPLVFRGKVTGAMLVNRLVKDEFARADLEIFVGLAQHVAIALENARLFKAEHEQRMLAEALRDTAAAISSSLDFDAVLDSLLSSIEAVIPHDAASIMIVQDSQLHIVKHRGFVERGLEKYVADLTLPVMDGSIFARTLLSREPTLIADTWTTPEWHRLPKLDWIRSSIELPLCYGDRLVGVLNVDSAIPNFFTAQHAEQLKFFVAQAAIALENASLYRELERYSQSLEDAVNARTVELRRIKERVEVILTSNPEPILLLAPDGLIESVNPAFCDLFQCTEGDVHSRSMLSLVHSCSVEAVQSAIETVSARGQTIRLEMTAQRRNDTAFDAALAVAPVWEFGALTGLVCTLRDISSLKEVQRMKDAFVANISHELRTPITSLRLYHHLLLRKPDKVNLYLAQLERETDRLQRIIENVLLLSRLDQNRVPYKPLLLDLNALAEQYVTDRSLLADSRKLTLTFNGQPELPLVLADGVLIGQALSIVLTNALNYTPEGGRILVTTSVRPFNGQQWVELRVADNGIGIPLEEQSHVFERFFRGALAIESGLPGTGLGLAIAKEIMDRHEGRIMMESIPTMQGAAFGLWLRVSPPSSRE